MALLTTTSFQDTPGPHHNILESGKVGGYGAEVLDEEPPPADHPLLNAPNTVTTSHIGSRTHESVIRQATMATENLVRFLNGKNRPRPTNSKRN